MLLWALLALGLSAGAVSAQGTGDPLCDAMQPSPNPRNVMVRLVNRDTLDVHVMPARGTSWRRIEPGKHLDMPTIKGWQYRFSRSRPNSRGRIVPIFQTATADRAQCLVITETGAKLLLPAVASTPSAPAPQAQPRRLPPESPGAQPRRIVPTPQPSAQPRRLLPRQQPSVQPRRLAPAPQPSVDPRRATPAPQPSPEPRRATPATPPLTGPSVATPQPAAPSATPAASDPDKKVCDQETLRSLLRDGEASGTATLDGDCRYVLTSAAPNVSYAALGVSTALVVDGNGAIIERAPDAPRFGLMMSFAPTITLRNVTLRNGMSDRGGAVRANRGLVFENVIFENNAATHSGGAVYSNRGDVTVRGSRFVGNRADEFGGALSVFGGTLTVDSSRFTGNEAKEHAGAVYVQNVTYTIGTSLFAENRVTDLKATAFFAGGGTSGTIANSTIADAVDNPASAIENWGDLTLRETIVANHNTAVESRGNGPTVTEDHNLFAGNVANVVATVHKAGGHSIASREARFADAGASEYGLTANSPAVDRLTGVDVPAGDLLGRPRPFHGTWPDIGAFEFQGQAGPVVIVEKTGPFWLRPNVPGDFTVTVANEGVTAASGLRVTDPVPAKATYEAGSVAGGATFADGAFSFDIPSLAPGERRSFTYRLSAPASVVSRDYAVALPTGERFVGEPLEIPVKETLVAALDFFPVPDGYHFANFTDIEPGDLTDQDLAMIFGPDYACKTVVNGKCVASYVASQWREKWLDIIKGGRCAGMATSSIGIFVDPALTPRMLQPRADVTHDVARMNARRLVTLYATTQTLHPRSWSQLEAAGIRRDPTRTAKGSDPVVVLDTLIANLSDPDATDRYRLSFRKRDKKGGHSVVPFAVDRVHDSRGNPTSEYLIYVYENNRPGKFDLAFSINRDTGRWRYTAQTNPSQPLSGYEGDRGTSTLTLVGWQHQSAFPKCGEEKDECPATSGGAPVAAAAAPDGAAGDVVVQLNGAARPMVTRSDGKRVGFDPATGALVSDIEGAETETVSLGLGPDVPPSIRIPHTPGMRYEISLAPDPDAFAAEAAAMSLFVQAADFATSLTGLSLPGESGDAGAEAGQAVIGVAVSPDANAVEMLSLPEAGDRPSLTLVVGQPGGSDISISLPDLEGAEGLALAFDEATQSARLSDDGGGSYSVEVSRLNMDGTEDAATLTVAADEEGVSVGLGSDWRPGSTPQVAALEGGTGIPGLEGGTVFLRSFNYGDRRLVVSEEDRSLRLLPVDEAAGMPEQAGFVVEKGLSDPGLVSLRLDGTDQYVVAGPDGVAARQRGTFEPEAATFRAVPGLAGEGISMESVALPGQFLRHSGFVLQVGSPDGSDLFRADASFLPADMLR